MERQNNKKPAPSGPTAQQPSAQGPVKQSPVRFADWAAI